MALSRVLLVDDSEVILTFGRGVLSGHYNISTAKNGLEALAELQRGAPPAAVVMDLSMPEMGGMDVLIAVRADSHLAATPIIILSSEDNRREDCLRAGADEFLAKPVRAPELLASVNRVVQASQQRTRGGALTALSLQIGDLEVGIPLECVEVVVSEAATIPLPGGPSFLRELIDFHGEAVLVLDTAARLGIAYHRSAADRVLVVVAHGGRRICLRADAVRDPEEIPPDRWLPAARLGGAGAANLTTLLAGVVRTDRGPVAILNPGALVSGETVSSLHELIDLPSHHGHVADGDRARL
jgi:CheY-like chemotaxis protein/chemotaxis signal transduction protein